VKKSNRMIFDLSLSSFNDRDSATVIEGCVSAT
jgi:hypothetical protein